MRQIKKNSPFSPYGNGRYAYICVFPGGGILCAESIRVLFIFSEVIAIASKDVLTNEEIRFKEVRVIDNEGKQLGIMSSEQALVNAYNRGLDLILISPNAQPPVCRIADFGKYRFEQDKREKEAKKKQNIVEVKEVQLSCRIETHDFETKVKHAVKFLSEGNKVRVVLRFKGREMSHQQLGRDTLDNFRDAVSEYGSVEKAPVLDGKNMTMVVSPLREKDKREKEKEKKQEEKAAEVAQTASAPEPETK